MEHGTSQMKKKGQGVCFFSYINTSEVCLLYREEGKSLKVKAIPHIHLERPYIKCKIMTCQAQSKESSFWKHRPLVEKYCAPSQIGQLLPLLAKILNRTDGLIC